MSAVAYLLAIVLGIFGFIFIAGSQGLILRIVVGIILLIAAGSLVYLGRMRPKNITYHQKMDIDMSGDVQLEKMKCSSCGAELSDKSVSIKAGAVFVKCEYCGAAYQIEEAPKW